MATTAPAAKTALVAAIRAAHEPDVLVRRGLPPAVPRERQRIYVTTVSEYRRTGPGEVRQEVYVITVLVEAHSLQRDDGDEAEQDMWALVSSIEDVLQDDPELDGAVWEAVFDGGDELLTAPVDDGWIASARVAVPTADDDTFAISDLFIFRGLAGGHVAHEGLDFAWADFTDALRSQERENVISEPSQRIGLGLLFHRLALPLAALDKASFSLVEIDKVDDTQLRALGLTLGGRILSDRGGA